LHNENQITCTCINRDCIRFCLDYNDLTKDINVCPNALLDIDKVLTTVILQYGTITVLSSVILHILPGNK